MQIAYLLCISFHALTKPAKKLEMPVFEAAINESNALCMIFDQF